MRDRGCPIPDAGSLVSRAICFPDTWAGLISNLLLPPTESEFWDRYASQEDRDTATQIAYTIAHDFLGPDCSGGAGCDPLGASADATWDFTADDWGWYLADPTMATRTSLGWEAVAKDLGAGFWQKRVHLFFQLSPILTITRFWTQNANTRITFGAPELAQTFPSARVNTYPAEGQPYSPVFAQVTLGLQNGSAPLYIEAQSGPRGKADLLEIDYIGPTFFGQAPAEASDIIVAAAGIYAYE